MQPLGDFLPKYWRHRCPDRPSVEQHPATEAVARAFRASVFRTTPQKAYRCTILRLHQISNKFACVVCGYQQRSHKCRNPKGHASTVSFRRAMTAIHTHTQCRTGTREERLRDPGEERRWRTLWQGGSSRQSPAQPPEPNQLAEWLSPGGGLFC